MVLISRSTVRTNCTIEYKVVVVPLRIRVLRRKFCPDTQLLILLPSVTTTLRDIQTGGSCIPRKVGHLLLDTQKVLSTPHPPFFTTGRNTWGKSIITNLYVWFVYTNPYLTVTWRVCLLTPTPSHGRDERYEDKINSLFHIPSRLCPITRCPLKKRIWLYLLVKLVSFLFLLLKKWNLERCLRSFHFVVRDRFVTLHPLHKISSLITTSIRNYNHYYKPYVRETTDQVTWDINLKE